MYVFGEIDKSSTVLESNLVNYTQNLSASAHGISFLDRRSLRDPTLKLTVFRVGRCILSFFIS